MKIEDGRTLASRVEQSVSTALFQPQFFLMAFQEKMSQQRPLIQVGQAGYGPNPRSPAGQGQTNQSGRHQDPSSILSVYPFMTYAPTARGMWAHILLFTIKSWWVRTYSVAQHLSPHHAFPQSGPPSSEIYPQYAQAFNRMEQPQTAEDWAMRQSTDMQIQQLLERQRGVYDYAQG